MKFSRQHQDIGRWSFRKVVHAGALILRALRLRLRGFDTLYYPPAGPDWIPILRDVFLLSALRPFFRRVIVDFHAAGISETLDRTNPFMRHLVQIGFGRPDLALVRSDLNPHDDVAVRAKATSVLPYGVEDLSHQLKGTAVSGQRQRSEDYFISVGLLCEDKGVLDLVQAVDIAREQGKRLNVVFLGAWESEKFRARVTKLVSDRQVNDRISFLGLTEGVEKVSLIAGALALVFPTWYRHESFGLVCCEAMSLGKPVIASRWRGLASIIDHGETGELVPPRDPSGLAKAMIGLLENRDLVMRYGKAGRRKYEREYQLERYVAQFEHVVHDHFSDESRLRSVLI